MDRNAHSPVPGARVDGFGSTLIGITNTNGFVNVCIPAGEARDLNVKLLNADLSFNSPLIYATVPGVTSSTPPSDIVIAARTLARSSI